MDNKTKALIASVVAALAAIITALTLFVTDGTPSADPSPTPSVAPSASPSPLVSPSPLPSPSPSVSPKPSPSPSPSPVASFNFAAARGEVIGFKLPKLASGCRALSATLPNGVTAEFFTMETITTTTPSFSGAAVGAYQDPLVPATQICQKDVWVDLNVSASALPGNYAIAVGGQSFTLKVLTFSIPVKPTMPFYVELQSSQALRAHALTDNVAYQGPITQKYIALYRAHRIEPIKQNISGIYPATDVNQWSAYQASFKQLVLDNAIAAPCIFGPAPSIPPTTAQLQDIEAKIKSGVYPADSWGYIWDEGEYDATLTANAKTRSSLVKQYAPSLKQAITRQEDLSFASVDIFYPVLDWFKVAGKVQTYTKPYGLYTSCMANGTCSNTSSPGTPSGTPMLVFDAPAVHRLAFLPIVYQMGGTRALYFNGTQMLPTAWSDQRNEGGNGDGTIAYPGKKGLVVGGYTFADDVAVASLRMKYLRAGSYLVEYMAEAKKRGLVFSSPIKSQFDWSKNEGDYQALHDLIASKL